MHRFTINTLGCKVNQYDAQSVAAALRQAGWRPVESGQNPDLVIVQTCCITATAMRKARQQIRRQVRRAPDAFVAILGCYAAYDADRLRAMLGDLGLPEHRVLVASSHDDLACAVQALGRCADPTYYETRAPGVGWENRKNVPTEPGNLRKRRISALDAPGTRGLGAIDRFEGHTRAFVKVQDGCDAFCNYCVVPYTRPGVWSRPIDEILDECRVLIAAGHRELVLCGVFLGAFGRPTAIRRRWSNGAAPLADLLARVAALPGLWRVRLSSLEPGDLTDDLLDVCASCPSVAPHVHLPLQSGSAAVLRRMNRQYAAEEFARTVDHLRARLDRPAVSTDIIVGYPGESETEFAETLAMAEHARFAKIHAFPFSAIEPTNAWRQRAQCPPPEEVRRRMGRLAELETRLAENYRRQFVGQIVEGLVESTSGPDGRFQAMTDRYQTVTFAPHSDTRPGQIVRLRLTALTETGLAADVVGNPTAGGRTSGTQGSNAR